MNILIRFVLNALAVMAAAYIVPGITVSDFWTALVAAIVIGLLNALVRPLVILLTLPVNILTLGLFTFVINALLFWLAASVVGGFHVAGFGAAFWGALVFWLISWFTNALVAKGK